MFENQNGVVHEIARNLLNSLVGLMAPLCECISNFVSGSEGGISSGFTGGWCFLSSILRLAEQLERNSRVVDSCLQTARHNIPER